MPQTCLNCKHFDEPEKSHKWHFCTWKPEKLPHCGTYVTGVVSRDVPFTDCPAWEERKDDDNG